VLCGHETLRLLDLSTGRLIQSFSNPAGQVCSIAFSPDGRQALTGHGDGRGCLGNLYPSPLPFIAAIALTVAFAVFLIAMKLRVRRRAAE